jgi:hypothetical protein
MIWKSTRLTLDGVYAAYSAWIRVSQVGGDATPYFDYINVQFIEWHAVFYECAVSQETKCVVLSFFHEDEPVPPTVQYSQEVQNCT